MIRDLPPGWTWARLDDLSEPSRPRRSPKDYPQLPYIGMEHVESGSRRLLATAMSGEMRSSAFHFFSGDILYGRLRPYLNKVLCAEFEGLCSSEFIVLPNLGAHDSQYLAMYLNNQEFVLFANSLNQGDRPRVNFRQIADHPIPLPPLNEQWRIASRLQLLAENVAQCRKRLDRIPDLLKRFRQSVLAAACSGKLTEEWRLCSVDGDVTQQEWIKRSLDNLIVAGPQNGLYKPQSSYGAGIPIVRIENYHDGRLDPRGALKRLQLEEAEVKRYALSPGDILVNRVNSMKYLGKAALIAAEFLPCVFESNMMRFRVDETQVLPDYLLLFLRSNEGLKELQRNAKHAVNQSSINQHDVRSIEIDLPSITEQTEILVRVKRLFALADQLENSFEVAKTKIYKLTSAILARAFRGELVPQDPNDEPAEQLLERIRAEREAKQTKVRKKHKAPSEKTSRSSTRQPKRKM